MRLHISQKRWDEILRVLAKRKRKRICVFGTKADGRYRVLWAAGACVIRSLRGGVARRRTADGKSSRNSNRQFLGVLFIHPSYGYWLTWGELRVIRKLLRRHSELVSGVLVSSEDSVAPYPVHFSKVGFIGTDMEMEDDSGFVYWQPRSALALLLRHPARGKRDGPA